MDPLADKRNEERYVPLIVGLGGTMRPFSSTERLLKSVLIAVEAKGARTLMLDGTALDLPLYAPHLEERNDASRALVEAVRTADGVILASPGYHGTISGHMKNTLDYIEDLSKDQRPYLDGRAVGCCAVAAGWQASVTTLGALRSVVHSLRGWPTPIGIAVNSVEPLFKEDGSIAKPELQIMISLLAQQVVDFANMLYRPHAAWRS